MTDAARLAFGDHRDPREELDQLFTDESATDWARGVLDRADIPTDSTVRAIAELRKAEPRLGLKSATYLATSLVG